MRSILSVDARQHLVSLIPELCVRNELDCVTSELLEQKRACDKNNVEANVVRTMEENIDFLTMIQNRYNYEFLRNQIRFLDTFQFSNYLSLTNLSF